ncbi:hypothetical protein [Clostridium beijerinckii]|uniref:hypothetical protein n=1 Tax=Clostridium beijerinckii TaxID=1520 RepID=UPI00098CB4A9|nr:hypothetical protein [Clostridium beijerinckii]MBA8937725.1 hypothetical protein [Clostridium beijerinckii]NSA95121.1 hypothetical protein [Clostridium beijerinckii]OOM49331.1 hypothetical protein CLBKI_50150 [Clostridium beijerinckii]OOM66997.1 hypothetical protein CLOBI_04840 [Clostridium beijerinckii]CUU51223.1 putative Major head protein [Clostridium beijerinckii]
MSDMIKVLNTIRANASKNYKDTVPVATQNNFLQVGSNILNYEPNANEFANALINMVAFTVVKNKQFKNPLSPLKKGGIPLGQDIQEIYTNPAKGGTYDGNSTQLLTVFKADTKVAYYRMNRQAKFRVTISLPDLQRAFTSIQALDQYTQSIINSMYSGDEIEQFELTKGLISQAYENNMLTEISVYNDQTQSLTDAEIAKALVKSIQTYSDLMVFPSTQYNKFAALKGGGATPVKTWTPKKDQVLIIPSTVKTNINVELLATAFNKSYLEMEEMMLVVDSFVGQPILGILCDKSCFQIYENYYAVKSFDNPDTNMQNYWLHHWQTFGFSLLANSIVFTYTPATVTLTTGSLGVAGDSKITGLTPTTQYKLFTDDIETPQTVTTNASGEITGLSNKNTYLVQANS